MVKSIIWFRRDFRLLDNKALNAAFENSDSVFFLFIVDPKQITEKSTSQSSFFASLKKFKEDLQKKNIKIHILKGNPIDIFYLLKRYFDFQDVYLNFDERGYGRLRDQKTIDFINNNLNLKTHAFLDYTLTSAKEIKKKDGSAYKVFTPYYKKWLAFHKPSPVSIPSKIELEDKTVNIKIPNEINISDLIDQNDQEKFDNQVGEEKAHYVLKEFIYNKLSNYDIDKEFPYLDATSHLSRYLRNGEISIRTVYKAVIEQPESSGKKTFIQELCWRDFYNMIYAINPNQNKFPINKKFQNIPWSDDVFLFDSWKMGKTGYPIIDAAMRQLNQTGWMHNRLRMIVASFLTKDLLINWIWGEQYFKEKLLDYDASSNIGGWQWAASTGTDSVPYFRIFNPVTQSEKFDPEAKFIKKFIPELSALPPNLVHNIGNISDSDQQKYGLIIGEDYPKPVVEHALARKKAIAAYKSLL